MHTSAELRPDQRDAVPVAYCDRPHQLQAHLHEEAFLVMTGNMIVSWIQAVLLMYTPSGLRPDEPDAIPVQTDGSVGNWTAAAPVSPTGQYTSLCRKQHDTCQFPGPYTTRAEAR